MIGLWTGFKKENVRMRYKAKIIIIILSILLSASIIYNIKILSVLPENIIVLRKNVPDEEAAIGIAKVIFKVYTGVEFNDDDFSCAEDETGWQVHLKNRGDFDENVMTLDDSGVFINKYDGTIEFVSIGENDAEDYMKLKAEYK